MKGIINRKQYDTETAELVKDDKYWDGHNHDRNGRSCSLYKTKKGAFFVHHETRWQGEKDSLQTVDIEGAKLLYEELTEEYMTWQDVFGEEPEIA